MLRRRLIALEPQLGRIDGPDFGVRGKRLPFPDVELHQPARGLGRDRHFDGLDVAVGIGTFVA